MTERVSGEPAGTILEPSAVGLRLRGSAVDLVVAAGTAQAKLSFAVAGTRRLTRTSRTLAAQLKLTKAADVLAALQGPSG